jgi:hypothetical protein
VIDPGCFAGIDEKSKRKALFKAAGCYRVAWNAKIESSGRVKDREISSRRIWLCRVCQDGRPGQKSLPGVLKQEPAAFLGKRVLKLAGWTGLEPIFPQ